MTLDVEVSNLRFFHHNCSYWFIITCWEGRVAFFSKPQVVQGRQMLTFSCKKSTHQKDVISLDVSDDLMVATASLDNIICFWNNFNGTESKYFAFPMKYADP